MRLLFAIILLSILPVDGFSQLAKEDYDFPVYTWDEVVDAARNVRDESARVAAALGAAR